MNCYRAHFYQIVYLFIPNKIFHFISFRLILYLLKRMIDDLSELFFYSFKLYNETHIINYKINSI